jgi:beta-lactamase class D
MHASRVDVDLSLSGGDSELVASNDSVVSWTSKAKPHGWFNQAQMLRTFSQAMDMELALCHLVEGA